MPSWDFGPGELRFPTPPPPPAVTALGPTAVGPQEGDFRLEVRKLLKQRENVPFPCPGVGGNRFPSAVWWVRNV